MHGLSVTTSFTKLTFVFGGVESHVVTTKGYLVFQQENPDNSKLAEKAAELTIGTLLDVPPGAAFSAVSIFRASHLNLCFRFWRI